MLAACAATPPPVATAKAPAPSRAPPAAVSQQQDYERKATEARQWQRRAAAVDGEWRDVDSLLRQAQDHAARGRYRRAFELAEMARFQAEMGYRQMQGQSTVHNPDYLYR